jgi:4-aminobutyrate aminotransferase/(S)-3-amino-2-methylpropionate transaminase
VNGKQLPHRITDIPGPISRQLAARLQRVESRNITSLAPQPPIFWRDAHGANVVDVDGNIYIDLTAGFGVTNAGHANPAVAAAIGKQSGELAHALGDVYPAAIKVELLEKLAAILPGPLEVGILGSSGAEAVEAALKTAVMHTRRTGIIAFENSYHGLTYGALALTHRDHFREPFAHQLFSGVRFAPFPQTEEAMRDSLARIDAIITAAENSDHPIGCIIVEPIQGRGGIVVPSDDFLTQLRGRCDGRRVILIFDEIYTGMARTGRWLACEHWNVVPDVVVIGKALSGALPLSAAIGTRAVMDSWPRSTGEAIHTSTFIGNPIACAAALAQIAEIERCDLLRRARALGERIRAHADAWRTLPGVVDVRGKGLLQGVVLHDANLTHRVVDECLQQGVLLLMEGPRADVLAITPPAVITDEQLDFALETVERALQRAA